MYYMASELTIFIKEQVYPALNAVDAGFLDAFGPKLSGGRTGGTRAYSLTCPVCGEKDKAFYYEGSAYIVCNRRNNCPEPTSIWSVVQEQTGGSNKDVAETLCKAVGLEMPKNDFSNPNKSTIEILREVLKQSLEKSDKALEYLKSVRGWSDEEIQAAPFGYIPFFDLLYDKLKKAGADMTALADWGIYVPDEDERKRQGLEDFKGRIVGIWEQPDGSAKFWGRLIREPRDNEKKYKFQSGLDKTIPCFFKHSANRGEREKTIAVEGTIDAARLIVNGVPAIALGGATFSGTQAAYLCDKLDSIYHWIDFDSAGIKGGIRAISILSELGVNAFVANPQYTSGSKDADEMITSEGLDAAIRFINDSFIEGGEFLLHRVLEVLGHKSQGAAYEYIRHLKERVSGRALFVFEQGLVLNNLDVGSFTVDALRMFTRIYEISQDRENALKVVKRKTGIDLKEFIVNGN